MMLFKIDGDAPQCSPNLNDIDPNKGTEELTTVTLYQSTDNGTTWTAVGDYKRNSFGEFGPYPVWFESRTDSAVVDLIDPASVSSLLTGIQDQVIHHGSATGVTAANIPPALPDWFESARQTAQAIIDGEILEECLEELAVDAARLLIKALDYIHDQIH